MLAATMLQAQPPEDDKVYKVGGAVSPPRAISKVEPEYTQEALKAQREGSVERDGVASEKAIEAMAVQAWRKERQASVGPGGHRGGLQAAVLGAQQSNWPGSGRLEI
jgi:hypothetical protein